jgi:SAM-dependent methyltransferase
MSQVFDAYAHYYDLVYADKDYSGESEYVAERIREQLPAAKLILELGCGTGAHAEQLARMGYTVHGVDMSAVMLSRAEARKASLPADIRNRLSFSLGDVRDVRTQQIYDVVISLFHVISYQATDADLESALETAAVHLSSGGLFLFDFWYGPAVLAQKPEVRVKRLENGEIKVTRIAEPSTYADENCVDVNYDIFIEQKDSGEITQVREKHKMRYIFLPELQHFLIPQKWTSHNAFEWLANVAPGASSWSAFVVARRK